MRRLAVWQYVGEEVKGQCYMRDSWQMPRVPPAHYIGHQTWQLPFCCRFIATFFYNHTT